MRNYKEKHKTIFLIANTSILLPYIGISFFPSDLQPISVVFSALGIIYMLANYSITIPKWSFPLILIFVISSLMFLVEIFILKNWSFFEILRAYFNYLTPLIISIYFYNYLKINGTNNLSSLIKIVLTIVYFGFF